MKLKEQCGCASCQGKYQQPVDNIDGYASGFELAPDPNQELSPELMGDSDFIQNIINQVLQQMQMGGGEIEEQLNTDFAAAPTTLSSQKLKVKKAKPLYYDPCLQKAWPAGKDGLVGQAKFANPGGGGYEGEYGEDDEEVGPTFVDDRGTIATSLGEKENKIREYIVSQIKSLSEQSPKVEGKCNCTGEVHEGSCGYSQSAPDGDELSTPGGIKGVDAQSRTNKMKTGRLSELNPEEPRSHRVQTNTASEDKSWWKQKR